MTNKSTYYLILIFLFSLCSCLPIPEKDTYVSQYKSHYRPHHEDPLRTTQTTRTPDDHHLSESYAASHKSPRAQPVTNNNKHSFLSVIARSVSRIFGFHHKPGAESKSDFFKAEEPADKNWESEGQEEEESLELETSKPPASPKTSMDENNAHSRFVLEESVNFVETATKRELSRDDLVQLVKLCKKMFQGIELALSETNIEKENETNGEPSGNGSGTTINEGEEMVRETLPDVRLALAQAAQLNRRREIERQQQLTEFENGKGQSKYLDYTEGIPRNEPL